MKIRQLLLSALCIASSAFAAPISYVTSLSGLNENPVNGSPGTGSAFVLFDTTAHTMLVQVTFTGMTGPVTAAHIHCCILPPGNVGVATQTPTFIGFPAAPAGFYSQMFDMTLASSYNASFITASGGTVALAEASLETGMLAGRAYLNLHSALYPGGEIRGFLVQTPEPSTFALAAFALAGLAFVRRNR